MSSNQKKTQDVLDNLMAKLGEFGPYQRWQYSLHVIAALLTGVHMYSLLTVAAVPEHRCAIPNVDINKTMADLNSTTLARYIPLKGENRISSCSIYDMTTNQSTKCSSWVYNSTYHPSSRAIEWNFVCDRRWMGALSQTIFMLGVFLGNIVLGNLADRVGRKPVYCWTALLSLILGISVAFTTEYYLFLATRFILGMVSCAGANMAGFVMTMELVGASKRSAVGVGYQIFFAFGIMLVAFWGWVIKDRQLLQITYGLHGLPMLIHWWVMDESPRWLWAKGRYRESLEIIQKALLFDGSSTRLDIDNCIPNEPVEVFAERAKNASFLDMFRTPNMRKRMLNIGLCWFANSLVYYGLSLGTGSMKGNPFLIIFIMGLIEIPGYILVVILMDRLGRRPLTSFNMIISGICCVLAVSITVGSIASTTLVYLGKFLIACSYSVIYIYSAELFPTMTRNSAIGFASMCARISGSLTPLITLLDSFDPKIPCIIFGVITICSGYLTLFLPETLGTDMPSTMEEGETFGLGDTFFSNLFGRRRIVYDNKNKSAQTTLEQLEPLHGIEKC